MLNKIPTPLLLAGIGAAVYFLFIRKKGPSESYLDAQDPMRRPYEMAGLGRLGPVQRRLKKHTAAMARAGLNVTPRMMNRYEQLQARVAKRWASRHPGFRDDGPRVEPSYGSGIATAPFPSPSYNPTQGSGGSYGSAGGLSGECGAGDCAKRDGFEGI